MFQFYSLTLKRIVISDLWGFKSIMWFFVYWEKITIYYFGKFSLMSIKSAYCLAHPQAKNWHILNYYFYYYIQLSSNFPSQDPTNNFVNIESVYKINVWKAWQLFGVRAQFLTGVTLCNHDKLGRAFRSV